jgi:hypothetical protein
MTEPLTFSASDAGAPTGPEVPTAKELFAMGVLGLDLGTGARAALMNQIGAAVGMPPGGWHGQAKLFNGEDIRLRALLARMAHEHTAKLMAGNLDRAGRFTHVNIMLALSTAAREFDKALTARGDRLINTYHEGGLDFLWDEKNKLGLPRSVTKVWQPAPTFLNPESMHEVHPAQIPAHDQLMAYAAQIGASFRINFRSSLRAEFGDQAETALASASRIALIAWQAYSFLAPGGTPFDSKQTLRSQQGQKFGHRSALAYFAHRAALAGTKPSLDEILKDPAINHTEWVHSAKTRTAETLFLERLLKRTRELLPH